MSSFPTAIAAWLHRHTSCHSVSLSARRCRVAASVPVSPTTLPSPIVHSNARRHSSTISPLPSASHTSSYQPVSSLLPLPAYNTLVSRLGQQQAHREVSWLIERITQTPLNTLRSTHPTLSTLIRSLPHDHLTTLHSLVAERAAGVPLQYLLGDVEWCGLSVLCRAPTLIPRPETEEIVDWLCNLIQAPNTRYKRATDWPTTPPPFGDSISARSLAGVGGVLKPTFRVLDLCTGSGCISLALAAHLGCTTLGTDTAHTALQLAHDSTTHIRQQLPSTRTLHSSFQWDDLRNSQLPSQSFDLVIANPPYIATADIATLQTEVQHHEDTAALDGGSDGTMLYPHIAALAARVLRQSGTVDGGEGSGCGWPELVVEIGGVEQSDSVMESFRVAGFIDCAAFVDRAGKTRWIAGKRQYM